MEPADGEAAADAAPAAHEGSSGGAVREYSSRCDLGVALNKAAVAIQVYKQQRQQLRESGEEAAATGSAGGSSSGAESDEHTEAPGGTGLRSPVTGAAVLINSMPW